MADTALGTDTWLFVAAGISLNDDSNTAEVKLYQESDTAHSATTSAGNYYLDRASAYKAVLGAMRDTSFSTFTKIFNGFIYGVWIENVY